MSLPGERRHWGDPRSIRSSVHSWTLRTSRRLRCRGRKWSPCPLPASPAGQCSSHNNTSSGPCEQNRYVLRGSWKILSKPKIYWWAGRGTAGPRDTFRPRPPLGWIQTGAPPASPHACADVWIGASLLRSQGPDGLAKPAGPSELSPCATVPVGSRLVGLKDPAGGTRCSDAPLSWYSGCERLWILNPSGPQTTCWIEIWRKTMTGEKGAES